MTLRLALMAGLCLALGFIAQALTAWALFVYSPYSGGSGVVTKPPLAPGEQSSTGFVVPPDWASRTRIEWWGLGKTRELVSEAEWIGSALGHFDGAGRQATYQGFAAGWPMRSFWGSDFLTPGVIARMPQAMVAVPEWLKSGGYQVPVSIRWQGAAVNSAVFALPLALAWAGCWRWRRRRRSRRGECLRCGYAAAGLVRCPECGRPGPSRNSAG